MTDCTIRLNGAGFSVTIPSDISGNTHTLEVPQSLGGLRILRKILSDRQREEDRRIGTGSSPTQQMVEEWLRTEADILRREQEEERKKKLLPDSGIDITGIEIDL